VTIEYVYSAILVMTAVTAATRAAPFVSGLWVGRNSRWVERLRTNLPRAVLVALLVYCLKDVAVTVAPFGLPAAAAVAACGLLQYRTGNALLSIGAGTALYVALTGVVFS